MREFKEVGDPLGSDQQDTQELLGRAQINKKEKCLMELEITLLGELKEMKDKMEAGVWYFLKNLFK